KYGKGKTNGRPKKKSTILQAERRVNDVIRRLCIRELTITEILERFPGYSHPEMILAEVNESVGIDMEENVNALLPQFFDHLPDNDCFSSGKHFEKCHEKQIQVKKRNRIRQLFPFRFIIMNIDFTIFY
ncbi:unnamed protein product, partial [Rotaria socialis]